MAATGSLPPWARDEMTRLTIERNDLRAECERHRKANLVRAVIQGVDPEWITEIISADGFDVVPWMIANKFKTRLEELEESSRR